MKRNVLLIAKRSTHAEAMVRYWPRDKWNVHLYTYRRNEWYPGMFEQMGDNWIAHNPGGKHKTVSGDLKTDAIKKCSMQSKKKMVRKYIEMKLFKFNDQKLRAWALPSMPHLKTVLKKTKPDIIVSLYEPLASNLIARRMAAITGVPWVVYFRDHCTTHNELLCVPVLWHAQRFYDRWVHRPLHSLVGVSPQFVDILNDFYNVSGSRSHVITGGFENSHLPEEIKDRCAKRRNREIWASGEVNAGQQPLKAGFIGILYDHQVESLCLLFAAFRVLLGKGIPCELTLWLSNAWYFFPQKVQRMIKELESEGLSVIFGSTRLPHSEALRIQEAVDVNLIVEGMRPPHSTAGTITSKIFDLMMIARPTIAICAPSLPIGDYLRETGIGTDCKDLDEVVARLTEIWERRQEGETPGWHSPVAKAIEQYSYRSLAKKMSEISNEICNGDGSSK